MFRTTVRWILMLVGLAGIAGGAMVWYAWVRGDEYAREELHRRLAEIAPACDLRIGAVGFDWQESLTVSEFSLGSKSSGAAPTLIVPEAVLQIDREQFLSDQTVEVKLIRFIRPRFEVTRRLDGTWTTDDLFPFHASSIQVPEWLIEDATIVFRLEQPNDEPVSLTLEHADLRLEPTGRRQLAIKCLSNVTDAGPLHVTGSVDLDTGAWSLAGAMNGLNTSGNIAGFALRSSAGFRSQVASLERKLKDAEDTFGINEEAMPTINPNAAPLRTVSSMREVIAPSPEPELLQEGTSEVIANTTTGASSEVDVDPFNDLGDLGINATVDLEFTVERTSRERALDYEVHLECRDGQVSNPLLPFPLQRLRGRLDWTREMLSLTSFEADAGRTSLRFDGKFSRVGDVPSGTFGLAVTDLILTNQPNGRLPPAIEHLVEIVRPSGPVDVTAALQRNGEGAWTIEGFELTAKGAAVTPTPFPYPIRDVTGTLRQERPDRFVVDMAGKAGSRPVRLTGYVNDPGEAAEVHMQIRAEHVPVDETFKNACPKGVQQILHQLRLKGTAQFLDLEIDRSSGIGEKYIWGLKARLEQGELEYAGFPYRLTNVEGDVSYDSRLETVSIWNAVGRHAEATITGRGTYRRIPNVGPDGASPIVDHRPGLDLVLTSKQVPLGGDVREALPSGLRPLWDDLRPSGNANVDAKVTWLPGYQPDIELTSIEVSKGGLKSRAFPYTLESIVAKGKFVPWRSRLVSGRLQTGPARLSFSELIGWHPNGGVRLDASGSALELQYDGSWSFSAPRFVAEDIQFGPELRRAAPESLRSVIESLDPRGRFLVEGRLNLAGPNASGETDADWDLTVSTRGIPATLNAGVELTNVVGQTRSRGSHRNGATEATGTVSIERAEILGQKLTRVAGPLRYANSRIEIGSAEVARNSQTSNQDPDVPIEERLSGSYLDGLLTFDAIVLLGDRPRYAGRLMLTAGSLERYAVNRSTGPPPNLAGVMTGWMNFSGQGTSPSGLVGHGRLDISPAALYELPVIMKMFKALVLVPPDGPAFSSAQLIFSVHDSAFFFDPREGGLIDLAGDTLRLKGGGRVGFDRNLDLEFYSSLPRNSMRAVQSVPVVGQVVGGIVQAATTGWVSVVVRGPADDPFVNTVPLKVLPDTWRQMFEPRGGRIPARTAIIPPGRR